MPQAPNRAAQLLLLTAIVAAAAFAGNALNPLQESLRANLGISDNQIAVLQGPALAIPMAAIAIPLGVLIDRHSRVTLLLGLSAIDVGATVMSALSPTFDALLIARSCIGLAAFAINPVACSMIADIYPPDRRGRASMVVVLGQSAGLAGAFVIGGHFLTHFNGDWRLAMGWMVVPLVVAVLAALVLQEPPRTGVEIPQATTRETLNEVLRFSPLIAPILVGVVMSQIALVASYIWAAPALSRRFELAPNEVGEAMGVALFLSGVAGAILGGTLADWCQRTGGPRRTISGLSLLALLSAPVAFALLADDRHLATVGLAIFITAATAVSVMGTTLFIVVIPNEIRGLSTAVMMAACILIGNGLAPILVSSVANGLGGGASIAVALAFVFLGTNLVAATAFAQGRPAMVRKA